ncbi:unnamed protein product [Brachionus calyciflorus]|uniref:Uncharacterized protein n=1 Tax=Brachionus calyciflorus TaxID=104777 RepID=A0A814J558_9BILA|nr:unnamed protein product [Brachionus calyciflorus]
MSRTDINEMWSHQRRNDTVQHFCSPCVDAIYNFKHYLSPEEIEFEDIVSKGLNFLTQTDLAEHVINVTSETPIKQQTHRIPYNVRDEVKQQLDNMLASGIIEVSDSQWASLIVLVRKSNGCYAEDQHWVYQPIHLENHIDRNAQFDPQPPPKQQAPQKSQKQQQQQHPHQPQNQLNQAPQQLQQQPQQQAPNINIYSQVHHHVDANQLVNR